MYFSTDKLYKLAKEALRGKKQEVVYVKLIDWAKKEFDLNVIYIDLKIEKKDNKPRLHLILENQKDYNKILINTGYNPKIQNKISEKFEELLKIEHQKVENKTEESIVEKLLLKIGLKSNLRQNFENIWVCYSVFLTVYATEISTEFTKEKIDELLKKYKKNNVWEIHMSSFYITIFLEKENQIEESRQNPLFKKLKEEYFEIVKEKDEFGLFKKEIINLTFDSKENFDKNYDSSWFYYYK
jgi:hypothetical protein